jgi:diguanylate cyclase (GGDEF)-like protein
VPGRVHEQGPKGPDHPGPSSLRNGAADADPLSMKRIPIHRKFAFAGAAAALACGLVVPARTPQVVAFEAMAAACVVGIVAGIRSNRPRHAWPWILIATSLTLSALGYLVWLRGSGTGGSSGLSAADALYLPAGVLFVVACLGFIPSWHGKDREVLVDVAIAAIAAAILLWALVVDPQSSTPVPLHQRVVFALYPMTDFAVLAILIRLAFIPHRGRGALWYVLGGFSAMLVASFGYAVVQQTGNFRSAAGALGIVWVLGLVSLATAALHPQMRQLTEPGQTSTALGWGRAMLLGSALLVAPIVLAVKELPEPHLGTAPIAAASAVVAVLVLWRIVRATHARQVAESTLAYRASHDVVTGLPNRDLLLDRIRPALARMARRPGARLVVIFLDLDAFKEINDGFGHQAGDALLVSVAERLKGAVRPGDTVARFGGDEFVVLAEAVETHLGAAAMAERVRGALGEPFRIDDHDVYCTASLGVAVTDRPDASPENLLRNADAAMYRAKERGRDRFEFFDDSMRAAAMERLKLDTDMRRALDRGEFELFYQPLQDIPTGAIVGAESLIRWNHPERGLILPADFIPAAEANGLIVPIGSWVIREALSQADQWRESGSPLAGLGIAVNVAPAQLREPDFVGQVAAMIEQSATPPSQLTVELTESALIDEVASSLGTVQALKDLGVRIALDDFGTGYSSLTYLRRFPVDVVKIDRSFVTGLGEDPEDEAIVAAIIAMSLQLGIDTVAEGVETAQQMAELRNLGCTIAQGYLMARPARARDLQAVCAEFNVAPGPCPVAALALT